MQPTPVCGVGEERPDGPAQSSGEMRNHRVDGNDQIEIEDERGGFNNRLRLLGKRLDLKPGGRCEQFDDRLTVLQVDELDAARGGQRCKVSERGVP